MLVIIPMYNVSPWIGESIEILKNQSFSDFRCVLVDDLSTDSTPDDVRKAIGGDSRFELLVNGTKKFALGNVYDTISRVQPQPDQVVVLLDGDDRLSNENVLQRVGDEYEKSACLLTYGSYTNSQGTRGRECLPYSKRVVESNRFRKAPWRASHLRTFKARLWSHANARDFGINERELSRAKTRALLRGRLRSWLNWRNLNLNDLLDPTGRFVRRCFDKALMYPLLELAGERAVFIEDVLYIYNISPSPTAYETAKVDHKWLTRCARSIIAHKNPRKPLDTNNQ